MVVSWNKFDDIENMFVIWLFWCDAKLYD